MVRTAVTEEEGGVGERKAATHGESQQLKTAVLCC